MDCSDFLSLFSEYYDGSVGAELRARMDGHLQGCSSCRRYVVVVDRGTDLLRSLPEVPVPSDFEPRLRHRIYHLADSDALGRSAVSSRVSAFAVAAIALLLGLAAWSPLLSDGVPEVTLPPIVVTEAPERRPELRVSPASFLGGATLRVGPDAPPASIWPGEGSLLFFPGRVPGDLQASPLLRTGID